MANSGRPVVLKKVKPVSLAFKLKTKQKIKEGLIQFLLFLASLVPVITVFGILFSLAFETVAFFREVSLVEFFTQTQWAPLFLPRKFGVLPLVSGTFLVTLGAVLIAIPLGLGAAVYLSEYASSTVRKVIKPLIEVLSGVPTVVFGYIALLLVTPLLRQLLPGTDMFNALSASIAMGIMILPMVASLSEDAMRSVPFTLREAAYALGANKFETTVKVVIPSALSGILASFVLAISRAIGETMIVAIAAGSTPNFTFNPLKSIQTLTGYIVQVSLGDTPWGSIEFKTIFAAGMLLFLLTFCLNLLSARIVKRSKYES